MSASRRVLHDIKDLSRFGIVVAVGCPHSKAAPLPAAQALLAHEPRDAIATVPVTGLLKCLHDARRAIGLPALLMNLLNPPLELLLLLGAFPRMLLVFAPVVIATGRNFKHLAENSDGMIDFQGVDPLVALLGGSERMPKVFLKYPAVGASAHSPAARRPVRSPFGSG